MTPDGTRGIGLRPLDVLFFRDGRPMTAGWQATSGLPLPQTFAGAVRTWLLEKAGCDFERLGRSVREGRSLSEAARADQPDEVAEVLKVWVRGPWLARLENGSWEPLVDVPANLVSRISGPDLGSVSRSDPLVSVPLPGWRPTCGRLRPLWRREAYPAERVRGFLNLKGLAKYLAGSVPDPGEILDARNLFALDQRVGIAVGPDSRSVEEGGIYSAGYLALAEGVGFYGEIVDQTGVIDRVVGSEEAKDFLRFGGDGKRCAVEITSAVRWPETEPESGQGRVLLLTTACPVRPDGSRPDAWLPPAIADRVIAAAVPGYRAFSGWDLTRRGPKPARFAVEAGAVYFLEQGSDRSIPQWLCDEEDAVLGWGHFLKGVWSHV